MQTASYLGDRTFGLEDIAPQAPKPGQAQIDVAYCGICGTDLHVHLGQMDGRFGNRRVIGQLAKAFANEGAAKGVNVDAIAPGYVDPDNTEALRNDPVRSKAILDRTPAGRWRRTEDFAGPIVFLASDASAYVHGTILMVDGGWMGR